MTRVLVVGGGIAGLEAALALHALAPGLAEVTLVEPARELVFRPMTVTEPFARAEARRRPMAELADRGGAELVRAHVDAVEPAERRVLLRSGEALGYDALILAPGARTTAAFDDAVTFGMPGSALGMRELVDAAAEGHVRTVAFLAPSGVGWILPLYELALLTAARCAGRARLILATPERAPLEAFGAAGSAEVARLLKEAGVELVGGVFPDLRAGRLHLGERTEDVDGVVALPLVRGPRLPGVPADPEHGFIPVDAHCRVAGLDGVYAAGDAIDFPVKQGGLATQQADAAAEHLAARLGADVRPAPFAPVLRGVLLTGAGERVLGEGGTPTKYAGRFLAPVLDPSADAAGFLREAH